MLIPELLGLFLRRGGFMESNIWLMSGIGELERKLLVSGRYRGYLDGLEAKKICCRVSR
jgi:hypothetical protein